MHRLGEGLLAGAGLAIDQQRHIALEHSRGAAKIVLQAVIPQADPRGPRRRNGLRCPQHRWLCGRLWLAAQQGEQASPVPGAQWPTGAGIDTGAAEQFIQGAVEKAFHRLAQQPAANMPQQVQGALVHRTDPAIAIKRQQALAEQPHRLRLQMKAQQPLVLEITQEIAALDHLRRQIDQGHGVELALPGHVLARRRHIQHRQQLAMGVEHRARRAGQAGVPAAEMLALVNGQRLALHQAGADAVGALPGLAPIGAQPQSGMLEDLAFAGGGNAVEDHAPGIGQQHRMPGAGQLLVQVGHLGAGNLQDILQALAAFQQAAMLKHRRGHDLGRVEMIVLEAAQPGAGNGRIAARALQMSLALGHGEHLLGMPAQVIASVHFLLFSCCAVTLRRNTVATAGLQSTTKEECSSDLSDKIRHANQHPPGAAALQCRLDSRVTGCAT